MGCHMINKNVQHSEFIRKLDTSEILHNSCDNEKIYQYFQFVCKKILKK